MITRPLNLITERDCLIQSFQQEGRKPSARQRTVRQTLTLWHASGLFWMCWMRGIAYQQAVHGGVISHKGTFSPAPNRKPYDLITSVHCTVRRIL